MPLYDQSIVTPSGLLGQSLVAGDRLVWSGTAWVPRFSLRTPKFAGAGITSSALTTMSLSITVPRATTYLVRGMLTTTVSASMTAGFGINVGGTPTYVFISWDTRPTTTSVVTQLQTTNATVGGAGFATATHANTSGAQPQMFQGYVTTGAASVAIQVLASASNNQLNCTSGCILEVMELG